jgi:selenocysteine-specific elongation factor
VTSLVVGVIGHVDHGKTALVRALTGEETDRLAEEKSRGISIALGFARLNIGPDQNIDLIDMPGHERFIRTMIAGATGIDAVLLVVAANEGVKPQTIEHIEIAGLLGLRRAVVAISKTDLVSPAQAKQAGDEAIRLLKTAGFSVLPPVLTSALREEGIEELRQTLATLAASQEAPATNGLPFLPIDRAFSIAGHGPVVTGTLRGAAIATGDALELFPARQAVRVRAVQVHGERVPAAAPGQRVALNLRDADISALKRGMALAAPGFLAPSDWLTISVRAVAGAPPLRNGMRLRALLGTDEFDARLRLLDRDVLESGASGFAQLHCAMPVAFPSREHVVLRLASPAQTVAGGRILDPVTRRQRRHSPPLLQHLAMLHRLDGAELILAEVAGQGAAATTLSRLSQLSALAPAHIAALLSSHPVLVTATGLVVRQAELEALAARIPALLAPHAEGLAPGKLLAALPGTGAKLLDEAITLLLSRNLITKRGPQLVLPRPAEDRARAQDEAALAAQIAALLHASSLSPPDPRTIITTLATKRAVDRLLREGLIIHAVDRAKHKEILFHHEAVAHAMRLLAPLLEQPPGLLATDVCAALGITRKYAMPLLDHLDTIRFTKRINDRRIRGTASLATLLSAIQSV